MASQRQVRRLAQGGRIDRSRPLRFTHDGRTLEGYEGDTVASALMANGVDVIGRSFKYHRPRGFYGVGFEDPNAMVAVRDAHGYEPAIRAGQIPLAQGLDVRSVTGWPSARWDLGAVMQLGAGMLGAGFYYKTLMWPNWRWFEPLVRRATGFGKPRAETETRQVEHRHATADVLVVGAGPAGIEAATRLSGSGLRIVLADCDLLGGGSLNWEEVSVDGLSGREWAAEALEELRGSPGVTVLPNTMVTAAYEQNIFTLVEALRDAAGISAERHWKLAARHVVLAAGAVERPLLFKDNDRPGIMLGAATRRLIADFAVAPCSRLAVYTSNDSGYLTALMARRAGIEVAALIDTRPRGEAVHADAAERHGIRCIFGGRVAATKGYARLRRVEVVSDGVVHRLDCDGLAVSGGWTPLIHLACHRGARPVYDPRSAMFVVPDLPRGWHCIGGAAGTTGLEAVFARAQDAADAILRDESRPPRDRRPRQVAATGYGEAGALSLPEAGSGSRVWVDFQNDVKVSDIELAVRENYVSVEHLKRYTTLGMGTDQGRTSNVNGLAVMAALTGRDIPGVGVTTFRPPFSSVRMGTIAGNGTGDLHHPRRRLPAEATHLRLDAVFEDFGWERPDWYRTNGADRETAVRREVHGVRNAVGVFDGSSLGKIEVAGPDAAAFLARFYVSDMATLKPGAIRYSVMLAEEGFILDDGVVARLGPNHFLAGPTSGNAERIAAWFERWRQTEWPEMQVSISQVTANWASIAIAGPRSRRLLARLEPDFDIGPEAFGHMQIRLGRWSGVPIRVARVSFTGELQYEISVPARFADSLLALLLAPGDGLSPVPVGMEAWLRLRLDKGYIHLGSDTNGRTTPLDIGMAAPVARRRNDFVGKRSLSLTFANSHECEQLVGLAALDGKLEAGDRVLAPGHSSAPCPTQGYVTSACESIAANASIGLALVERGFERRGEEVVVYGNGRTVRARIVEPVFYDAGNERLKM